MTRLHGAAPPDTSARRDVSGSPNNTTEAPPQCRLSTRDANLPTKAGPQKYSSDGALGCASTSSELHSRPRLIAQAFIKILGLAQGIMPVTACAHLEFYIVASGLLENKMGSYLPHAHRVYSERSDKAEREVKLVEGGLYGIPIKGETLVAFRKRTASPNSETGWRSRLLEVRPGSFAENALQFFGNRSFNSVAQSARFAETLKQGWKEPQPLEPTTKPSTALGQEPKVCGQEPWEHGSGTLTLKGALDHRSLDKGGQVIPPPKGPTGMEGASCNTFSGKPLRERDFHDKSAVHGNDSVVNPASNKICASPLKARKALARKTCDVSTRQAIYEHIPEASSNEVLFRWAVYTMWTTWRDRMTHRRILHHDILHWIGLYRFRSAEAVLEHIDEKLGIEYSDTWAEGSHTRQVLDDGLPPQLWKTVQSDLETPTANYGERVYVLSGDSFHKDDATDIRTENEKQLTNLTPPSSTAERIWQYMNEVPSQHFSRFQSRLEDAYEYVRRMKIDIDIHPRDKARLRVYTGCKKDDDGTLGGNIARYRARVRYAKRELAEEQRRQYFKILGNIELQHKPYYKFSRQKKTDRIFSHNDSVLLLPSEVRNILCEGLYDVDLKSAHLFIAAWLWDSDDALETLSQDGYCVWDELIEYCRPLFEENGLVVPEKGTVLYDRVKGGIKMMLYSTVYGMDESAMQAKVTKALQGTLGSKVGKHLKTHPLILELLEARNEKLQSLKPGDTLEAPTGIEIEVEITLEEEKEGDKENKDKVGPKSAVATQAQAYEQELMSILIDVAEDRPRFYPILWLHDGAVCKARHPNALKKDINEALEQKRKHLTDFASKDKLIPAIFEIEEIQVPEFPAKDVHDRIAAAGGGAVRLKEGETAVKVATDGQEIEKIEGILLKDEHELYKLANTYIRLTDEGYDITQDPFPEDKIWQPLSEDRMTRSTSSDTNGKNTTLEMSSEQIVTSRTAFGVEVRATEDESIGDSGASIDTVEQPLSDSVQRHLEKQKRLSNGNIPDHPREAERQGFNLKMWLSVHARNSRGRANSNARHARTSHSTDSGCSNSDDREALAHKIDGRSEASPLND